MKIFFTTFLLFSLTTNGFTQDQSVSINNDTINWIHQRTYNHIIHSRQFRKGMSDDEMAGILLYSGGNNLKGSFACEFAGILMGSLAVAIGPDKQSESLVLSVVSSAVLIVGVINLLSGYNKISKAGIILQHKGINIRPSPTGVTLNF